MYEYHPAIHDDESVFSDMFSANSQFSYNAHQRFRKEQNDAKLEDKGYHCYYKKIYNNRPLKVEMYDSGNSLGYRIRDPTTGARLSSKIGSKSEKDFFKVRWCGLNRNNPVTLFYDSPEHFERHHKTSLHESIKEKWWKEHRIATVEIPETNEEVLVTVVH